MALLAFAVGILLGSVSTARIVARRLDPTVDISKSKGLAATREGYTGVSASAVGLRYGARWGVLVAVLDGLKALIPTLAAQALFQEQAVVLAVAAGVVVGHVYPVYHRFHGGRGQACTLGALLAIDPVAVPIVVLGAVIVGLSVFASVYVARNGYPLMVFPWFLATQGWGPEAVFAIVVGVVTFAAMVPDLVTERRARHRFGQGRRSWGASVLGAWREMFDPETT